MAHDFATPQEALAHYGVKGMKWGVRSTASESVNPGLSRSRTTAIKKARASVSTQKAGIKSATTPESKKQLTKALKEDPNYVASRLMTRGEKALVSLLGVAGTVGLTALDSYANTESTNSVTLETDYPVR